MLLPTEVVRAVLKYSDLKSKSKECVFKMQKIPHCEEKRMGHDDLPMTIEGDISIVSVVPQISQPSDDLRAHV